MRITGGEFKGRVLGSFAGQNIRPTSSKVRQAVFNIIGNDITGMSILDLYAGTGIMGIEALSRGGSSALFIDNSNRSLDMIKKNLRLCRIESRGHVIKKDLREGLPHHSKLIKGSIDLVFLDPPYGKNLIPGILDSVAEKKIMSSESIIVTESKIPDHLPEEFGDFYLVKSRSYGDTKIGIFYRKIK